MARRKITGKLYADLVRAFEREPGRYAAVGRSIGVDWRTAKRAWEFGLNLKDGPKPAIKDMITAQATAFADPPNTKPGRRPKIPPPTPMPLPVFQSRVHQDTSLDMTYEQAIATHEDLGKIMRGTTQLVGANAQALVRLAPGMIKLADRMSTALESEQLSAVDGIGIIRDYTRSLSDLNRSFKTLQESARTYYGAPSQVIQLKIDQAKSDTGTEQLTVAQMLADIERAAEEARALKVSGEVLDESAKEDTGDGQAVELNGHGPH